MMSAIEPSKVQVGPIEDHDDDDQDDAAELQDIENGVNNSRPTYFSTVSTPLSKLLKFTVNLLCESEMTLYFVTVPKRTFAALQSGAGTAEKVLC